jgi:hypothetical protein
MGAEKVLTSFVRTSLADTLLKNPKIHVSNHLSKLKLSELEKAVVGSLAPLVSLVRFAKK